MNLSATPSELKSKVTGWAALVYFLLLLPSPAVAADQCSTGYVSSTVKPTEYNQWATGSFASTITVTGNDPSPDDDVVITGSMTKNGESQSIYGSADTKYPTGGAIFITQNMNSNTHTNIVKYTFSKPLIDLYFSVYSISNIPFANSGWNDKAKFADRVKFIARNGSVKVANPVFMEVGQVHTSGDSASAPKGINCEGSNGINQCRFIAKFKDPITELSIEYGNTDYAQSDPDSQNIQMSFNSFCVEPVKPKSYTFSGTVFNDNGGIASPDSQMIDGIYNNTNFFNGIFDPNEAGIDGMNVVKARLRDCSNNPSADPTIATVDVTNLGKYNFSVSSIDLKGKTDLCIEEIEPNNWLYSVDTTPSIRKFSFDPSILNYQTGVKVKGNTLNLDFGNVIKENTALVLDKSQYVHDCSLTDLTTIGVDYNGLPTVAFSKQPIADIEPGQCIAYRIEAINRGNVPLTAIIIKDTLQKTGEGNAFATSTLITPDPIGENNNTPTFSSNSVAIGSTGMVITNKFNLGATASDRRKAIRFNTKYGSIAGN